MPVSAIAASSTNYNVTPEITPQSTGTSDSANYDIDSAVGDTAVGESSSENYRVRHGTTYDEDGLATLNFKAVPEKRVSGRLNSRVIIEVRSPGNVSGPSLFKDIVDTDSSGMYEGELDLGVTSGVYDIYVKGFSHLKKMVHNYYLTGGINYIDFTTTNDLLAGDVNVVDGSDPMLEGDDIVNSIDLGMLIEKLDLGSDIEKTDLNKDDTVNAIDLGIMIENLDQTGERP